MDGKGEVFGLQEGPRTRAIYGLLMTGLALFCFWRVVEFPLDVDDGRYLKDSAAISEDFSHFWSPDKDLPGRPTVELVLWLGYEAWGEDLGFFHLLVVGVHLANALLLALLARRTGTGLETSLVGGLLFLVNVAHFRAVYWVSAIAYPLALLGVLGALLCCAQYRRTGGTACLAGAYGALLLGVLAHASAAAGWAGCAYLLRGQRVWSMVPLLLCCGLAIGGLAHFYAQAPQVSQAVERFEFTDAAQVFLWLWGRLWSTAHWLPVRLYERHTWELVLGLGAVALWGMALWRRVEPAAVWGGWIALFALPSASRSADFFLTVSEGPSRYLYLASAGSSMVLAWMVVEGTARLGGRIRAVVAAGVVLGLAGSSWVALERAGASSFFTAGYYNYFNAGVSDDPELVEQGLAQLQMAVEGPEEVVPLEGAYFSLIALLLQSGEDPLPWVERGRARLGESVRLEVMEALLEQGLGEVPEVADKPEMAALERRDPAAFYQALAVAYHRMGKGYFKSEDYGRAIEALRKSMHYDERAWGYGVHTSGVSYHKLIRLGVACNRLGRHQEALEAYAKVLEIRPAHPVALFNLGLTYAMLGKSEEARRQYEALVGRDEELADQLRESLGF